MPDKKQFDSTKVNFWLSEIKSSETRKLIEMLNRNSYPDVIKIYEGEPTEAGKKLAYLQDYFPHTNQLLSEILYQDPEPLLESTRPTAMNARGEIIDVEQNIDTMKGALKYATRKLELLVENRIAGFDMLYAGMCFVEINHKVKREASRKPQKSLGAKIKEVFTKEEHDIDRAKEEPDKEESYSLEEETYGRRWNPLEIGIDYRAGRIKDIRFIYKIIKEPYAEFIAEYPDYEGKVKPDGGDMAFSEHKNEAQRKMVKYYEVQHLLKNNECENFIIAPSYPFEEIDYWKRPYKTNRFNIKIGTLDEYGRLYPKSRAAIAKPNHDDKQNYKTFMMEVAEKSIPKVGYNKGKVKEDGKIGLESKKIGALVPSEGGKESTWNIDPPQVSLENKELIAMMEKETEEIWGVSKSRMQGRGDAKFMGELEIQEAGFQERRIDIQEGLRRLWKQEYDGLKDIIVTFWDGQYWFKITGQEKPSWYVPDVRIIPATGEEIIINPLTDVLTADYEVDIDVTSTLRPNRQRKLKDMIEGATWLINVAMPIVLVPQGFTVSVDEIKHIAKEIGFNPEKLIVPLKQPVAGAPAAPGGVLPAGEV